MSFEVYASQGIFFLLFRSAIINVENKWVYCLLIAISTFAFSALLYKAFLFLKQKRENGKWEH